MRQLCAALASVREANLGESLSTSVIFWRATAAMRDWMIMHVGKIRTLKMRGGSAEVDGVSEAP